MTAVAVVSTLVSCSTGMGPDLPGPEDLPDEGYLELQACNSATPSDIEGAKRDSLPETTILSTVDDEWAQAARSVPGGWGGYFLVEGQKTMYMVEPPQAEATTAALASFGIDVSGADVWRGDWDFAQLYDWRRYIFLRVGWPDGLTMSDIDELRNRLVFGVEDESQLATIDAAFGAADLPCGLVELTVVRTFIYD